MFENFKLAAIVKTGQRVRLWHVPLHQGLQSRLASDWYEFYERFLDQTETIEFVPGYKPEEHERICIDHFELPEGMNGESSQSVPELETIPSEANALQRIRGIAAFARDNDGEEVVLFQNFMASRVIGPGRFLFLRNDTYQTPKHPGLTLGWKIDGIFVPSTGQLIFSHFRMINTFLPLMDYYAEATAQDIRDVLEHESLAPQDVETLAAKSNQWMQKRFAMLRDSGILDDFTPEEIVKSAQGIKDVEIELDNDGRIVFPSDKKRAKRLLQFLNEELYRGAMTDILYETNSKRQAD